MMLCSFLLYANATDIDADVPGEKIRLLYRRY